MNAKIKDRLILTAVIAVPVVLLSASWVWSWLRIRDIRKDAPFELTFHASMSGRNITINAKSLNVRGKSGLVYPSLTFKELPKVYFWYDGQEVLLGRFKYG